MDAIGSHSLHVAGVSKMLTLSVSLAGCKQVGTRGSSGSHWPKRWRTQGSEPLPQQSRKRSWKSSTLLWISSCRR